LTKSLKEHSLPKSKTHYVRDLLDSAVSESALQVTLLGWIKSKRNHGSITFFDVADSTGSIQAIVSNQTLDTQTLNKIKAVKIESAVSVSGLLKISNLSKQAEILVSDFEIINPAKLETSPYVRSDFDIFDAKFTDLMLRQRHLYIRNPKVMAILRFRSLTMEIIRRWFAKENFLEFDAPILVPAPLYDDRTAIDLSVHENPAFLSQCAGFYLEAASQAFEKVYNMAPSFRGEESRSKRHLSEYWHVKAEIAWGDIETIINIVENFISYLNASLNEEGEEYFSIIGSKPRTDGMKIPYPRISYSEAVNHLKRLNFPIEFGMSIGSKEEDELSKIFKSPFWLVGIPRAVEPFPYSIDQSDKRLTIVADLIASDGYGELLGVAEKIFSSSMLDERMAEKNKSLDERYNFVREVHDFGCSPHIAFGMGLERAIRWFLSIPHVRDTIPFPRVAGRSFYP